MNFDKYKNDMFYPSSSEFRTKRWYKRGQQIAIKVGENAVVYAGGFTEEDLKTAVSEVEKDEDGFRAARSAYDKESGRLHDLFMNDLFEDLGIQDHPKRHKLFSKAWEMGHSSGYHEVYNCACDLVDLIKD